MARLTQERARELLDYDPLTGVFLWKPGRRGCKAGDVAGSIDSRGHRRIGIDSNHHMAAHRLAWLYVNGEMPRGELDHINGIYDDNRICNLRECDRSGNMQNAGMFKTNTSGYTGVTWHRKCRKWAAQIWVNNKRMYLGLRETKEEAYALYLAGKAKYHTFQPTPRELAA